jgi:hypothetical protein
MLVTTADGRPGPGSTILRLVLVALGTITAVVAANVAFGGIETLGLQGPTDFVRVTDQDAYLIRDSHAHYYGGVYLALGLFLVYAATDVARFRQTLFVVFALIFAGGLARLAQLEPDVTFGADLAISTVIELVGMPLLAIWTAKASPATRGAARPVTGAAIHA